MTNQTKPKPARVAIVCSHCGGKNVMRDAWAEWDEQAQEWCLGNVFDQGFCADCENDARLDEVPLGDEAETAPPETAPAEEAQAARALAVLRDLLAWADTMGGWNAPVWDRARALSSESDPCA